MITRVVKAKRGFLGLILGLSFLSIGHTAETPYSGNHVEKITASQSRPQGACLSFEAEYVEPVREDPSATLDIVSSYGVNGVISKVMKALRIDSKTFRFDFFTDRDTCKELKNPGSQVSVTVGETLDENSNRVLPEQRNFHTK